MFISVDLPAPFSPSRACTSPRRRSKLTASLARTPGKRFVMPRSSRTGGSESTTVEGDSRENDGGRARWPALRTAMSRVLLDLHRRLDLAGDDLRAKRVDLLHEGRRNAAGHPAEADALVLQVEVQVAAALELPALGALDGEVHAA